jgi:peptidoglycan/xylan/chitin deacetylase (PgdA/CDA1 family)
MDFRLDRLATLYLVSPLLRQASRRDPSIPILMYHSISDEDESGLHAYYRTCTSPQVFADQMAHLHNHGYSTYSLAQALDCLRAGTQTATKPVVITFDDGYSDLYRYAFPTLSRYGFSATVFLPTAYIGDSPLQFKRRDCLTWAEVRELNNYGILFGSHTVTHPWLRELSAAAVNEEIVSSKKTIEEKLGCAVESFAYPFAFPQTEPEFTKVLRDMLRLAGYQNGVSTIVGRAKRRSEPLFLERLPVNSGDDAALFNAKLAGAYDWISRSQYFTKIVKTRLRTSTGRVKSHIPADLSENCNVSSIGSCPPETCSPIATSVIKVTRSSSRS